MTFTIRRLRSTEFALYVPVLVNIYVEAMGYPDSVMPYRIDAWRRDCIQPGFTAVIAEDEDAILGLAYGFLGNSSTWWDRQLRMGLQSQRDLTDDDWDLVRHYFEVAEIHVHPAAQGQGLGRTMLHELVRGVSARYALLSTPEVPHEDNGAFGLYRAAGFYDVMRNFHYPGDDRPFAILAARLPLEGTPEINPETNTDGPEPDAPAR